MKNDSLTSEESKTKTACKYRVDVFSMSSCTATSKLIHNGVYIQKLLQLSNSPAILRFGRLYYVTKVLLDRDPFHSILATIQYFKFRKSAIMDQFMTFRKGVYMQNELRAF